MSTYTAIAYHLVISTKDRIPALSDARRDDLFRYVWGILKNRDCHLYRIGGVADHLHILTGLHPSIALAELVKELKTGATRWIKQESVFANFTGWQDGYGAFTVSPGDIPPVIEYIKGQAEHHRRTTFADEFRQMLVEAGIEFEEKYLL